MVGLGGLDEAVEGGAGGGAAGAAGEQPVLAAQNEWTDRPFNGVGVWGELRRVQVADELGPLLEGIAGRLAERRLL